MNKTSTTGIVNYEKNFILGSSISKKLFVEFSGNTGDGNSRLIFDDLYMSANLFYGVQNSCNVAPLAENDIYVGVIGGTVTGNIKANDFEPDGEATTVNVVLSSSDGKLVISQDGQFAFTPDSTFMGTKTQFFYSLSDNGYTPLTSNVASVTINLATSILAIKILDFSGKPSNSNYLMTCTVANNESVNKIILEYSVNGKDFYSNNTVLGNGRKNDQSYSFVAKAPLSSKTSYRLKIIDKNEQVQYSKILLFDHIGKAASSINYINATSNKAIISFTSAFNERVEVVVSDISGGVRVKGSYVVGKGDNKIDVPIKSNVVPGVYVVRLTSRNGAFTSSFLCR
jgi:hypothetical protein